MIIRHTCSAVTVGLLTCAAAFAQASGQAPSVSDLGSGAGPITIVGCLQREADYRRQEDIGGVRPGMGNEYVLVNTTLTPTESMPESACTTTNTGAAVELTGSGERHIDRSLVGHWVEVSGMLKKAKLKEVVGTSGSVTARPTGGFDPFGHDLKLREVNVASFKVVPVTVPLAAPTAAEPAIAPEPAPPAAAAPEQPAVTPPAQVQPEQLPRTASTLPLTGTIGLIALTGALALRAFGRRQVARRG